MPVQPRKRQDPDDPHGRIDDMERCAECFAELPPSHEKTESRAVHEIDVPETEQYGFRTVKHDLPICALPQGCRGMMIDITRDCQRENSRRVFGGHRLCADFLFL